MYQPAAQEASIDPIISRLRPRTVGEVLDQAFRLYRRNFLTFIAIIAVVVVPLQLAQQIISALLIGNLTSESLSLSNGLTTDTSTSNVNGFFAYVGVLYAAIFALGLLSALFQSLSQGALTAEIANSYLDKPVSFGDGYRQMFSRLGALLGVIFLQIAIGIGIFLPIILLAVLSFAVGLGQSLNSSGGGGAFVAVFCFSCFLTIPALALLAYVFMRLYVVTPVIMVEHLGPVQALRRSWELVRNYWWRTFGLFILLAVLGFVVQLGPAYLIDFIAGLIFRFDLVTQQIVSGVVTVFTTLVFIPIQLTAVTLYYFDLRVRKEGYDIETALAQRYAMPAQPSPAQAGAGYGQPGPATPAMPYPNLGQEQTYYGYNYEDYRRGAPTQPVGQYEQPGPWGVEPTPGGVQSLGNYNPYGAPAPPLGTQVPTGDTSGPPVNYVPGQDSDPYSSPAARQSGDSMSAIRQRAAREAEASRNTQLANTDAGESEGDTRPSDEAGPATEELRPQ